MAQLVEHILGKDEVISSNLISSSKSDRLPPVAFRFQSKTAALLYRGNTTL